jgi:Zn-dependent protease
VVGSLNIIAGAGVALGFLLGIVGHHWAHARAAIALGDKTPKLMGRASLRPKRHADTLGSIIMPAVFIVVAIFTASPRVVMFGWGKPQSFNVRAFRKPRRDMVLVALAGPAATLLIAVIAGVLARATVSSAETFARLVIAVAYVNSFLTVIELLPIPGRDGGRILMRFLSPHAAMRFEEFTQYDVLFLLVIFLLFQGVVVRMVDPVCRQVLGQGFPGCFFV